MKEKVLTKIKDDGIVAIIRGIEKSKVLRVVGALRDGGINCIEVTLNTANALDMIKMISEEFEDVFVGAGTVIDVESAQKAHESGAKFILSPSLHKDVIGYCNQNDLVSVPGAFTPTEIVDAHKYGGDIIKVFPAGISMNYIKMVRGPLDNIDLMAVGGVDNGNIDKFINMGCVAAGLGSSLVQKKLVEENNFDEIKNIAISLRNKIIYCRGHNNEKI